MIHALARDETEILSRSASEIQIVEQIRRNDRQSEIYVYRVYLASHLLVDAALFHVLVLRGDQRLNGQQIAGRFARAENHIPYAANKRFYYVLHAVQSLLGT